MTNTTARFWLVAVLVLLLVAGGSAWLGHRQGHKTATNACNAAQLEVDLMATQAALNIETMAREREKEMRNDAETHAQDLERQLAASQRDVAAGNAAAAGLRKQVASLVANAKRTLANSGTAGAGEAAARGSTALDLLAELHSRTDEAAGELAAVADEARIRGLGCEARYESVRQANNKE